MTFKFDLDVAENSLICEGEFVISHEDCVLINASERIDAELDIEVLHRYNEGSFKWVRFTHSKSLEKKRIEWILKPLFASGNLKLARSLSNGTTSFELLIRDEPLNCLKKVLGLPFGGIKSYKAGWGVEKINVLISNTEESSGRDQLLDLEKELKAFCNAELLNFRGTGMKNLRAGVEQSWNSNTLGLSLNDFRLLNMVMKEGYYENPRRTTIVSLSRILQIDPSKLEKKLDSLNRQIVLEFMKEIAKPLPPEVIE
jgi:hypothetical protein